MSAYDDLVAAAKEDKILDPNEGKELFMAAVEEKMKEVGVDSPVDGDYIKALTFTLALTLDGLRNQSGKLIDLIAKTDNVETTLQALPVSFKLDELFQAANDLLGEVVYAIREERGEDLTPPKPIDPTLN